MQQTDVVRPENWYYEALVSIVGPTIKRLPALCAELVRRPVTVLVATTTPAALAAKTATAELIT